jgi:hypothetical protein
MSEYSVIVWDLETVPDLAAAARLFDLEGAPEAQVREALGSGFPKHPLHTPRELQWSEAQIRDFVTSRKAPNQCELVANIVNGENFA